MDQLELTTGLVRCPFGDSHESRFVLYTIPHFLDGTVEFELEWQERSHHTQPIRLRQRVMIVSEELIRETRLGYFPDAYLRELIHRCRIAFMGIMRAAVRSASCLVRDVHYWDGLAYNLFTGIYELLTARDAPRIIGGQAHDPLGFRGHYAYDLINEELHRTSTDIRDYFATETIAGPVVPPPHVLDYARPDPAWLTDIQRAINTHVDEMVRTYNPPPPTPQEIRAEKLFAQMFPKLKCDRPIAVRSRRFKDDLVYVVAPKMPERVYIFSRKPDKLPGNYTHEYLGYHCIVYSIPPDATHSLPLADKYVALLTRIRFDEKRVWSETYQWAANPVLITFGEKLFGYYKPHSYVYGTPPEEYWPNCIPADFWLY